MKNFKKEIGITLIALIITIIVMLILVGVTINVALNGGLIEKARTAQNLTQKQVEKEELIVASMGAYNEKTDSVDIETLENSIDSTKYPKDTAKTNSSKYVVTGQSGTLWQIDLKTGEVTEYQQQNPWQQWGLTAENIQYDTEYTIVSGPAMAQLGSTAYVLFGSEGTLVNSWDDPFGFEDLNSLKQQKVLSVPNNNSVLMLIANNEDGIYDSSSAFTFNNNSVTLYNTFGNLNYTSEQVANLSNSEIASIAQQTIDDDNLMGTFVASDT